MSVRSPWLLVGLRQQPEPPREQIVVACRARRFALIEILQFAGINLELLIVSVAKYFAVAYVVRPRRSRKIDVRGGRQGRRVFILQSHPVSIESVSRP